MKPPTQHGDYLRLTCQGTSHTVFHHTRGLASSLLLLRTKAALLPSLSYALRGPGQRQKLPQGMRLGVAPSLDPRALVSIPTSDLGVSGKKALVDTNSVPESYSAVSS